MVAECDSDDADAEPHWLTEDDASAGDDVPLSVVREWMLAGAGDDVPLSVARDRALAERATAPPEAGVGSSKRVYSEGDGVTPERPEQKRVRTAADTAGQAGDVDMQDPPWDDHVSSACGPTSCPAATGLVTKLLHPGDPLSESPEALAAEEKEMRNMLSKGTFCPDQVCDWAVERKVHPDAIVGKGKMILGIKNSEMPEEQWAYKGRLVFMGNNLRGVDGQRVMGTTDGLYGTPISISNARYVLAVAALRSWGVEVADVEGAYLTADLGGPPVYLRMPERLWRAAGVSPEKTAGVADPCLRVQKAMYGLPRSGFDWFSHADDTLTKIGWKRMAGVDSVYLKDDGLLALYVDDLMLAGPAHSRRREWAAIRRTIKLRGDPGPISRFLGVHFSVRRTGHHASTIRAAQPEYISSVVGKYNEAAPLKASPRATPAAGKRDPQDEDGDRAGDCRSHVGALMYIARASRPDITCAVNHLARRVSGWTKADDADLAHLMGYLQATEDFGLEMEIDVRDRKAQVWLELFVDADHAGGDDRRSTGGWVLVLRGAHGSRAVLDWASRRQAAVARSSGEAETTALHDAIRSLVREEQAEVVDAAKLSVGVNRALCAGGIPALDFIEKALGAPVELRVFVDATVCLAAATKGTSKQMRYLTKTQGVDLFWLRDAVKNAPLDLRKVSTADNIADIMTKPLPGPRTVLLRDMLGVRDKHREPNSAA